MELEATAPTTRIAELGSTSTVIPESAELASPLPANLNVASGDEDARPCPNHATMDAAWIEADKITDSSQTRLEVFETLLTAPGKGIVSRDLQDESLAIAASQGEYGLPICALLLQHGDASPEQQNAKALVAAPWSLHLGMLEPLARSVGSGTGTTDAVWRRVFDAFAEGEQWLQPRGLEVVQFLLQHGASGDEVDAAFCKAARLNQQDAVELLAELLATAITPRVVDLALTADVNYQNGEPLQIAIRHGSIALLRKLLATGNVAKETMSLAFVEAIISTHEEGVVLSLLDVLASTPGAMPDITAPPQGYQPPLFACLAAHPQSAKLAKKLIDLKCDVDSKVYHYLYDDEDVAAEPATALSWALSLPDKMIGSAVIKGLMRGGANVQSTQTISRATPLILAAKNGRGDIVATLIKANASVSARDCLGRSALFYASKIGEIEGINALLKAKPPVNDGSLHEAARNLHSTVVTALLKAGHSPDFPSSKEQHQGRTAIQELALMCDASKHPATAVEETLRALLKGKTRLLKTSPDGKNAVFLALDNAHPIPITKALLSCAMWEHIKKLENVFLSTDDRGTKCFFPPTMYISLGLSQGPQSANLALINLLRENGCEDRFYAEEGAEQPETAVGMPQNILDAERKRKDHEERLRKKELEHQLKLLHRSQEANLEEAIERQKHEEKMFRKDETARKDQENREMLHQQQLLQSLQRTEQNNEIYARKQQLQIQMTEAQEAFKARAAQARAVFEYHKQQRMIDLKNEGLAKEQALKKNFAEQTARQRLMLQERQDRLTAAANEQKLQVARKMAHTREIESNRKLAIKAKQDQLALKLMRGTEEEKRKTAEMKMWEMHARGEKLKMELLNKHFAGQGENLNRIMAS